MTAYNRADYLECAILSIINQTYTNLEIIVSLDLSECEETQNIVMKYAAQDVRIKPYFHKKRVGAGANIRHVLTLATGEYFAWADEDDYRDPKWFERVIRLFDRPDAVIGMSNIVSVNSLDQIFRIYKPFNYEGIRLARVARYFLAEERNGKSNIVCGMFKTSFIRKTKHWSLYTFNRYEGGDLLFCLDCVQRGNIYVDTSVNLYKRLPKYTDEFLKSGPNHFEKAKRYFEYMLSCIEVVNGVMPKLLLLALIPVRTVRTLFFQIKTQLISRLKNL
ncbi:glycosyltransferase family 2 protein [Polynucleobacter sp. MWH-Braz-FAM2G]|uniref:glycosyltransferase family 2 protein n=1 Tax=Polynucleobacter sp. MWH-Braz-FAM2G TaxID=1855883 RepID=UPI0021131FDE|nr:glycosyltransferase family 2 protein [Polynucleobacter sp. MWH-Braz-FAM2G]